MDKEMVIEQLELAIRVLETGEKECGWNHLGVKVQLNTIIKLLKKDLKNG